MSVTDPSELMCVDLGAKETALVLVARSGRAAMSLSSGVRGGGVEFRVRDVVGAQVMATAAEWLVACLAAGAATDVMVIDRDRLRYPADLGARIKGARDAVGLTLDQMAYRLPIGKSRLNRIEQGIVTPEKLLVAQMAVAVGVTVGDLLWSDRFASMEDGAGDE